MLTQRKARKILQEGKAQGNPLTDKQRRFFGARASGYPMRYGNGGEIEDLYTKGTAQQLWDDGWDVKQRTHFLIDHYSMLHLQLESDVNKYAQKFSHSAYKDLPDIIKTELTVHHAIGFYAKGGEIKDGIQIVNSRPTMKSYLTRTKKQLLAKINSIEQHMQNIKDPKTLEALNEHIQKMQAILHAPKLPIDEKMSKWKTHKTLKRLNRK